MSADKITRLPEWENLLKAAIDAARAQSFEWGKFDCALAACDLIAAMTGTDPGAPYRGRYKDEAGALAIAGGELLGFFSAIAAGCGFPLVPPMLAHHGDLVLRKSVGAFPALGIVGPDGRFALCAGEKGLARVRMKHWIRAWRVG